MSRKWYGSLQNRLMENKSCEEITVGMGMTEYGYSDRYPYEVIEVKDQKHVTVRELDHKAIGEAFSNDWELVSNENNPSYNLTKRGEYWYRTVVITKDVLEDLESEDFETKFRTQMFLVHNNVDVNKLAEKGKITRYHKMNVSFGKASYYYDYEF